MKKVLLVLLLALLPTVSALEPVIGCETSCHNLTHINNTCDWLFNGTLYPFNQGPMHCPYGCDSNLGLCNRWPGNTLPGEYLLFFEIVGIGLLIFGIYRLDVGDDDIHAYDVILPLLMFIIFVTLSLQANNVIDTTTGEAVQVIYITWLNFGLSTITLILFFLNMFKYIKAGVE
jgi:hypothetical protein